MSNQIVVLGSAVAFGVGVAVGHFVTRRYMENKVAEQINDEMKSLKKYYAKLSKREEYADPIALADQATKSYVDAQSDTNSRPEKPEYPERSPVEASAIHSGDTTDTYSYFDYRREIPKRSPQVPYVISYDEFFENPKDYDQRTLTYFSKDDVLVEERDTPIDDPLGLLGPVALDKFGHGSKDPNIVYVRNDRLAMDLEVCFDPDSFEETVLGHIKHGESRKVRKFRLDDD